MCAFGVGGADDSLNALQGEFQFFRFGGWRGEEISLRKARLDRNYFEAEELDGGGECGLLQVETQEAEEKIFILRGGREFPDVLVLIVVFFFAIVFGGQNSDFSP